MGIEVAQVAETRITAVVDTSALVSRRFRHELQQAAQLGMFRAIWSPWIIAELNRVLTWLWIRRTGSSLSGANEHACARAAKSMMEVLLPAFDLVAPLPPYPPAWEALHDVWDYPIWAAAVTSDAKYVVSEDFRHFPPLVDGRHVYQGIEYIGVAAFLDRLSL